MCVDHAGLALFPSVGAFRCIGRPAFPLYCFLLVQGFRHTRDLPRLCASAAASGLRFGDSV
ncbi:MAG: TraX family protein [Christensenellales bacterium]